MIATVIDTSLRRASGSLFGLAYGDALGKPTEFLTVAEIVRRYGPAGPRELAGDPALVTDDTQMALAVGLGAARRALVHPGGGGAAAAAALRRLGGQPGQQPRARHDLPAGLRRAARGHAAGRRRRWPVPRAAARTCGSPRSGCLDVDLDTLAGLAQLQAGADPRPPDRRWRPAS